MDASKRAENFDLLRLLLASLVIFSHSPELLDGNRSREFATKIWGTMSLGEMGVLGFFVVSGFLITQSLLRSRSLLSYLTKRVLRIYPGFLLATLVLFAVVSPLAGASGPAEPLRWIWRAFWLAMPPDQGAFAGLHYPVLNGSMWSIPYEFRCYLILIFIWWVGLLKPGWSLPTLSLVMLIATSLELVASGRVPLIGALGDKQLLVRTLGVFLVGVSYSLAQGRLPIRNDLAALSALLLTGLLSFKATAEPAFAILGGYLILWVAQAEWLSPVSRLITADVSYGIYLYAWPVASLLIYHNIIDTPWILSFATLAGASLCGWLSWTFVERPCQQLKKYDLVQLVPWMKSKAGK